MSKYSNIRLEVARHRYSKIEPELQQKVAAVLKIDSQFTRKQRYEESDRYIRTLVPMFFSAVAHAVDSKVPFENLFRMGEGSKCIADCFVRLLDLSPEIMGPLDTYAKSATGKSFRFDMTLLRQLKPATLLHYAITNEAPSAVKFILNSPSSPDIGTESSDTDNNLLVLAALSPTRRSSDDEWSKISASRGMQTGSPKMPEKNIVDMLISRGVAKNATEQSEKNSEKIAYSRNILCIVEEESRLWRKRVRKPSEDREAIREFVAFVAAIARYIDVDFVDEKTGEAPIHAFVNPLYSTERLTRGACGGVETDISAMTASALLSLKDTTGKRFLCDVNKRSAEGYAPLMYASMHDTDIFTRLILELRGNEVLLDAKTSEGMTALHLAARYLRERNVAALLSEGASIIPDNDGNLPGQHSPVVVLPFSGEDENTPASGLSATNRVFFRATEDTYVDASPYADKSDMTLRHPYLFACRNILEHLIDCGMNLNHENDAGETVFHSFCRNIRAHGPYPTSLACPMMNRFRELGGKTRLTLPLLAEAVLMKDPTLCSFMFEDAQGPFEYINSEVLLPVVEKIFPSIGKGLEKKGLHGLYLPDYFRLWKHVGEGSTAEDEDTNKILLNLLIGKGMDCTKTAFPSSILFWCYKEHTSSIVGILFDNGARFAETPVGVFSHGAGYPKDAPEWLVVSQKENPVANIVFRSMAKKINAGDDEMYETGKRYARVLLDRKEGCPVSLSPVMKAVANRDVVGRAKVTSDDFAPLAGSEYEEPKLQR